MLDLNFSEDSTAKVDMNVVMTGSGQYVEVQGTGEETPFTPDELQQMLALAKQGVDHLIAKQKEVLGEIAERIGHQV
ncbi:ribonuclease PH, partial [Stenotrophomonas maltophilia]